MFPWRRHDDRGTKDMRRHGRGGCRNLEVQKLVGQLLRIQTNSTHTMHCGICTWTHLARDERPDS